MDTASVKYRSRFAIKKGTQLVCGMRGDHVGSHPHYQANSYTTSESSAESSNVMRYNNANCVVNFLSAVP